MMNGIRPHLQGLVALLLFSSVGLWGEPSPDAVRACNLFLGLVEDRTPEEVFRHAVRMLENGTGTELPDHGRSLPIPPKLASALIDAFIREYKGEAPDRAGRRPAPASIASGNVGHMDDHLVLYQRYAGELQRELGIDPQSLKLALVAHDIGKAYLNEFIDDFAASRVTGTPVDQFIKRYVLAHELHSIANIPRVVSETMKRAGMDTQSPEGRKLLHDVVFPIIESVRLHNGVLLATRMKTRYPDLSEADIAAVVTAWWPKNYRSFASDFADLGVRPEYGNEVAGGAIPATLNFLDRATLTSPTAPAKLGKQQYSRTGFTLDLIESAIKTPAKENIPLIRAQATQLQPYLVRNGTLALDLGVVKEAKDYNERMIALGEKLLAMNQKEALAPLSLKPEEEPKTAKERRPGEKEYLYFQSHDGTWFRVEGNDPQKAVTQKRMPDGLWKALSQGGHPMDHLMKLATDDRMWERPPATQIIQ